MGSIARGKLPHLIQELLDNPSAFKAFQALYLLETNLGSETVSGDNLHRYLSVVPAAELSFPAGEIRHCIIDDNDRFRLEVNFLGFYGVDSPLPQFFNDITVLDTATSAELRAFLELFNQRLYHLLYSSWKKMNLHACRKSGSTPYCGYLKALSGGSGMCDTLGRFDYAGIIGSHVKNGQSLAGMLEDFLESPVRVQENIPCWIGLEDKATLGSGFALGRNTLLGNRLMDVNSKILIQIGPIPSREASQLLPGQNGARTLAHIIGEYLDPTMHYDLELIIQPDMTSSSTLGITHSILGWTTFLGHSNGADNRIRLTGESMRQTTHSCTQTANVKN